MKIVRKLLLFISVWMVLMLAGCIGSLGPIAINTTMTIDTSFNGSRVMSATIPASVFKRAFDSNADTVEKVITEYTPGEMYCTVTPEDDGSAVIEMHIDFGSRNEYQKKIEKICAGNQSETAITPVITFDYSRSILKDGYTIEENFTSLDLFYWLSEALVQESSVLGNKTIDDIFTLGTTNIVFDGENIEVEGNIQISTIKSEAFDSITVSAELHDDQSVDAEITYVVSNKIVASLNTKLDSLMKSIVPDDADLTYRDGDSNRIYYLTFDSPTLQDYESNVNKALHTSDTVFEVTTEGDTESLSAKKSIKQYYDGSYFLDFTNADTEMSYILKVSPNYTVEDCVGTYGYLKDEVSTYSDDMCEIVMNVASTEEVIVDLGFAVDINAVDVTTNISGNSKLERTIAFQLSAEANSLIGSSIKERLETAASSWEEADKMVVADEMNGTITTYKITLSANSVEELTNMTLTLLGHSFDEEDSAEVTDSVIRGGTEKHTNPWKINASYEDTLNFSRFLKGSQISQGIHYTMTYPSGFKAAFAETNTFEDAATNGPTLTCSTYNKVLTVKSTAQKLNIEGILIFILWLASGICFAVILFMHMEHIYNFVKNKTLDIPGEQLFKSKAIKKITICILALVCFVVMTLRLLFKIY